ncbi:MAG: EamA family transporter [Alphaproteobacteria bacterium]|nr:EamA family transporter [Alphaproteobacteria bacterium]
MTPRDATLATMAAVLWGFNLIAGKIGVGVAPPLFFTALRFLVVAALVVPFCPVEQKHWPSLIFLSVCFGTGHFGLLFVGLAGVDAATAAITLQLGVPFSILISWLVFQETFGWRRSLALALTFIGVAFLAGEPRNASSLSFFLLVICTVFWAWSNVLVKRMPDIRPLAITGWLSLFAAPQVMLLSLFFETGQGAAITNAGWPLIGALAYTAIAASIIAHATWYGLVQKYPVNSVVPFNMLIPIVGVGAGLVVLGEPLTWQKALGGVLTLAGVGVIQWRIAKTALSGSPHDAR